MTVIVNGPVIRRRCSGITQELHLASVEGLGRTEIVVEPGTLEGGRQFIQGVVSTL